MKKEIKLHYCNIVIQNYRNSNAQLHNSFKGIENCEEVASPKGNRLKNSQQSKLGRQLLRKIESIGLFHFRSRSETKSRKSVEAIIDIKIEVIRRCHRSYEQIINCF